MLGKILGPACIVAVLGAPACAEFSARLTIQPIYVSKSGGAVAQVGDVYHFDLIATLRGYNTNLTDEALWGIVGSLYSSNTGTGTCRGDLTAITAAPFNSMGPGAQRSDLDGDGDLDAGGNDPNVSTGYFIAYYGPPGLPTTGAPQQFKIADITFTLTQIISNPSADADTRIRFALRPTQTQAQCWFYSDGEFYANSDAWALSDGGPRPLDAGGPVAPSDSSPIGPADVINDPSALLLASTSLRGIVPAAGDYFVHGSVSAGPISVPGLTRIFAGTVSTPHLATGGLKLDSDVKLSITGPATDGPNTASAISLDPSATLDLGAGSLVILSSSAAERDSALADIEARLAAARNGGALGEWSGAGITFAAEMHKALVLLPNDPALGGPGLAEFNGVTLSANSIIIAPSMAGDFNLDGCVDIDDYFRIDTGYARLGTHSWQGDINFDGKIDSDDYFAIDSSFVTQFAITAPTQSVPEPATVLAVGAGLILALRRRRG